MDDQREGLVTYLGAGRALDPVDDRLWHEWLVDVIGADGFPVESGAAGSLNLRLDEEVAVEVDPLVADGVLSFTVRRPEERRDEPLPLLDDIAGPTVTSRIATLREVGDIAELTLVPGARWRALRRLAIVEHMARRLDAPTDVAPSLWAAEAAWAAVTASPSLRAFAQVRARESLPALRLFDAGWLMDELGDLAPQLSILARAVADLVPGEPLGALTEVIGVRTSAADELTEPVLEPESLLLGSIDHTGASLDAGLTFRGSTDAVLLGAADPFGAPLGGPPRESSMSSFELVLVGCADELLEDGSTEVSWSADTGTITLRANLTDLGVSLPDDLVAADLSVLVRAADTGRVVGRAGVQRDGDTIGAEVAIRPGTTVRKTDSVEIGRRVDLHAREAELAADEAIEAIRLTWLALTATNSAMFDVADRAWQSLAATWDRIDPTRREATEELSGLCAESRHDPMAREELALRMSEIPMAVGLHIGLAEVMGATGGTIDRVTGVGTAGALHWAGTTATVYRSCQRTAEAAETVLDTIEALAGQGLAIDQHLVESALWDAVSAERVDLVRDLSTWHEDEDEDEDDLDDPGDGDRAEPVETGGHADAEVISFPRFERTQAVAAAAPMGDKVGVRFVSDDGRVVIECRDEGGDQVALVVELSTPVDLPSAVKVRLDTSPTSPQSPGKLLIPLGQGDGGSFGVATVVGVGDWLDVHVEPAVLGPQDVAEAGRDLLDASLLAAIRPRAEGLWRGLADHLPVEVAEHIRDELA